MFDDDTASAVGDDALAHFLNADYRGGGTVINQKPSDTVAQAAAQIGRLNDPWTGTLGKAYTVTYAFRTSAPFIMPSDTTGFTPFTLAQQKAALLAMNSWSDVANITFVAASVNTAQILFGDYTSGESGAVAFTYFPPNGDVWVNGSLSYEASPTYLGYGRQTLLHEIGHALGLSHPGDYDAGSGTPTYASSAVYYEDTRQYTVMSYWSESNTGADFQGSYASAPLMDDIAAIQRFYGANMTTRTGDTTYGFNSNTGLDYYTATSASSPLIFSVWDAGGNDTFDFSGYANNQIIDLHTGSFSSVGGLIGNVSIAAGVTIENAIGGSGNDTIIGTSGNNRLIGNAGDDTLTTNGGRDIVDGGAGNDTLVLPGNAASYTTILANGSYFELGKADSAQLSNIETVKFADATQSWASLSATAKSFDGRAYLAANPDLIKAFGNDAVAATNQFVSTGYSQGRTIAFDGLAYIASYPDLMKALGTDASAGLNHYLSYGYGEGRTTNFDPLQYVASNPDLVRSLGTNTTAAEIQYITSGYNDHRPTATFNALEYTASNPDLIKALGDNVAAAESHYITYGYGEGRATTSFNALEYIASSPDLIKAFGENLAGATRHYIDYGYGEGRATTSFDALKYIASYGDLIKTYGEDVVGATKQYIDSGYAAGRTASFDALAYAAASPDLAKAFGTDQQAAERHYIDYGYREGRTTGGFDPVAYLLTYSDLGANGVTPATATSHWLTYGAKEGRIGDALYGRDQTNHSLGAVTNDKIDSTADHDWFQFTAQSGGHIMLVEEGTAFASTLQLFDSRGALLSTASSTMLSAWISISAPSAGTYYLGVASADGRIGNYSIYNYSYSSSDALPSADAAPASDGTPVPVPAAVTAGDLDALMAMPASPSATVVDTAMTNDLAHAAAAPAAGFDAGAAFSVQAIGAFADQDLHHLFDLAHHQLA
jgi:serralysin